jgi:hypothetical protein
MRSKAPQSLCWSLGGQSATTLVISQNVLPVLGGICAASESRSGTHAPQEDQIPGTQRPRQLPATTGRHRRGTSPATPRFKLSTVSTTAPVLHLSVGDRNRRGWAPDHSSVLFPTNKPPEIDSCGQTSSPGVLLRLSPVTPKRLLVLNTGVTPSAHPKLDAVQHQSGVGPGIRSGTCSRHRLGACRARPSPVRKGPRESALGPQTIGATGSASASALMNSAIAVTAVCITRLFRRLARPQ